MKETKGSAVAIWLLTGAFLILAMVVIGGITRLTQSGLSMADWSVSGSFPPLTEEAWNEHFSKYKATPEFRIINKEFSLSDYKKIFWWEYIHRFLGRTIGLVFIIPFLFFLIKRKFPPGILRWVLVLFVIGCLQGALGWFMVKSGLSKIPHVSHYRLAAHLLAALLAFGLSLFIALKILFPSPLKPVKTIYRISIFLAGIVFVQIMFGAFVSGLKAGYVFNTFPMMGDSWVAPDVLRLEPLYLNAFANGAGVQFIHRWLAIAILITAWFAYKLSEKSGRGLQAASIRLLSVLASIQVLLGIFTLIYQVPLVTAVLHQAVAFILFGSTLMVAYYHK